MSEQFIRDNNGKVIGRVVEEGNGNLRLHRANGTIAGTWYKATDGVHNDRMQFVGRGLANLYMLLD